MLSRMYQNNNVNESADPVNIKYKDYLIFECWKKSDSWQMNAQGGNGYDDNVYYPSMFYIHKTFGVSIQWSCLA
jgi:hypothetical protein